LAPNPQKVLAMNINTCMLSGDAGGHMTESSTSLIVSADSRIGHNNLRHQTGNYTAVANSSACTPAEYILRKMRPSRH